MIGRHLRFHASDACNVTMSLICLICCALLPYFRLFYIFILQFSSHFCPTSWVVLIVAPIQCALALGKPIYLEGRQVFEGYRSRQSFIPLPCISTMLTYFSSYVSISARGCVYHRGLGFLYHSIRVSSSPITLGRGKYYTPQ